MGAPPRTDRRRRSTAEVQAQIRAAALTVFARRGYAGTATRAIATEAGVAEALIFRHFGSKANLYREVVLAPLAAVAADIVPTWGASGSAPAGAEVDAWVRRLLQTLRSNRDALRAVVTGGPPETPPWELVDAGTGLRAAVGMVFALVALDPWLWNGVTEEPAPADLAEAVISLLTWGVAGDRDNRTSANQNLDIASRQRVQVRPSW